MPRTSVSCLGIVERRTKLTGKDALIGFTLLEMLVVMALVAMAVGLVAPATLRGLDAARERGLSSDLEALLASLPLRAFREGSPLSIDVRQLRANLVDLPAEWRLNIKGESLQYGPTGMAAGGEISMQAPGRDSLRWKVSLITGEVKRLP